LTIGDLRVIFENRKAAAVKMACQESARRGESARRAECRRERFRGSTNCEYKKERARFRANAGGTAGKFFTRPGEGCRAFFGFLIFRTIYRKYLWQKYL
jgi:hypothetical protein